MKIKKYIENPYRIINLIAKTGIMNWMNDEIYLKMRYRATLGKKLNLKNPKTFNEKIQWLKINDRKDYYHLLVDKYEAKKYVSKIIGSEKIIETIGVWEKFENIDFSKLPNSFVLKCTHDSGGLVICKDKEKFDYKSAQKKINKSLKNNYFYWGREWPYKNVKPRIIAEEFLNVDSVGLVDYKFYCFDGEPKFLYVSQGLDNHKTASISFLTLDWKFAQYKRSDYKSFEVLPKKPNNYDEMIEISKKLSKGFPFLRVDLYEYNDKIYFSELTFSPCSGFMPFTDEKYDIEIGNMLVINQEEEK